MKTLKLLSLAMFAIFFCLNLSSCSKDDEDGDHYLKTSESLPSYVITEFKNQIEPNASNIVGNNYKSPYVWTISYVTIRYVKSGFTTRQETTNGSWRGKIMICANGNVDFQAGTE